MAEHNHIESLNEAISRLRHFTAERNWGQFHDPKNLAMALSSEAGELLAELRWVSSTDADEFVKRPAERARIIDEVADIAIALLLLCDRLDLDLLSAISDKIKKNSANYPVETARGNAYRLPRE